MGAAREEKGGQGDFFRSVRGAVPPVSPDQGGMRQRPVAKVESSENRVPASTAGACASSAADLQVNPLKAKLAAGGIVAGIWQDIPSAPVTGTLAVAGFDFVI